MRLQIPVPGGKNQCGPVLARCAQLNGACQGSTEYDSPGPGAKTGGDEAMLPVTMRRWRGPVLICFILVLCGLWAAMIGTLASLI